MKITRPLAKTTAQQVKPLTQKSQIQNVKRMQQRQRRERKSERVKQVLI